jgi:hypothetical protein
MPATSDEILCEACQDLFGEERYDTRTRLYEHHRTPAAFRKAVCLPCSLCVRLWIYLRRWHHDRFEQLAQSDWTEFDRQTPITYDIPKRFKLPGEYKGYRLDFSIPAFGEVRLILERWDGKIFVALRLFVSPQAKRILEARRQLYTHSSTTSTGDDSALQFLLDNYQYCQLNHITCRRSKPAHEFYPTRLVDVTSDDQGLIRLCENPTGPYTALSHCWGTTQPFTLTRQTVSKLRDGVLPDHLPKTFRDAIAMTRKSCLQYIWIDSL